MKVALIIEHFDAQRGGAERFAVWLAQALVKRGVEVHVVCHDAKNRINRYRSAHQGASHDAGASARSLATEEALPAGVQVHRVKSIKLSTGMGFRMFGQRVRTWCRRHPMNVVHSISAAYAGDVYHPEAGVYIGLQEAAIASRETRGGGVLKRFLLQLPGKARTLLALEQRAVQSPEEGGAAKIICISEMVREEFVQHYGVSPTRLVRLDNPRVEALPDLARVPEQRAWFRAHYGFKPGDRVAAFVGHDFRRKGLKYAIETIGRCGEPWKLLVVGLGKMRRYVELAEELGLESRVKFVGPTREMAAVYAASDALLFPTFYDSFGFVAMEALSYGLPVISTRKLGCYPIVPANCVGTIVESPRDVTAMAAALDALPAAGPEKESLGARARAAGVGLTEDDFVAKLLDLYKAFMLEKQGR